MDIGGSTVLILGGSGLVGMAIARDLLPFVPAHLVVSGLTRGEAETAVAQLRADPACSGRTQLSAEWGDIFLPAALHERTRADVLADADARARLLDDLFGELREDVVLRSALGAMLLRHRPAIVIDSVSTAAALAYQNVFDSATRLRARAHDGAVSVEDVERHLATLYLPQLIRHVQIALDAMRRAGTAFYLKIGTAGTGGMGLNVPFTHSEERPSRMLLAKSGVAGAHSLLLFLMARTPGAPAVKEIKPTAAITWKSIGFGDIVQHGQPLPAFDAISAVPLDDAFRTYRHTDDGGAPFVATGTALRGVYMDAGENGLFTLDEFETLTALGLMEFITPEEVAADVIREIRGQPTGHDVVAALDAATAGPTYRAGVLREVALEHMERLEAETGVRAVAYEKLGPPRLSKLLFEAELLSRLLPHLSEVAALEPLAFAQRAERHMIEDDDLRIRIVSIGLPILLADGARLLRGPAVSTAPDPLAPAGTNRLADAGWVDLRPANWRRWVERARGMLAELGPEAGAAHGSRADLDRGMLSGRTRPGRMAAWVFRHEDRGSRIKR